MLQLRQWSDQCIMGTPKRGQLAQPLTPEVKSGASFAYGRIKIHPHNYSMRTPQQSLFFLIFQEKSKPSL